MTKARPPSLEALVLLLMGLAAAARAQQVELRRVDIRGLPLVQIEARARDLQGRDLPGLLPQDFDVRLDGSPVPDPDVASAAPDGTSAPVYLLVDRSGDLSAAAIHSIRKASSFVADSLPSGTPIAVYSFDETLREELHLTEERAAVRAAITNISPGRGTSYVEPLRGVVDRASSADPSRSAVVFVLAERHYPGARPSPGRAYSLSGQPTPIYPLVVSDDGAGVEEDALRIARRLSQGLPGLYRIAVASPFGTDGEIHSISVALKAGGPAARCRFRAQKGPAIGPSTVLESALRRATLRPFQGAFFGVIVGALVLLVLARKDIAPDLPLRLTPLIRLAMLGLAAVAGALLAVVAFPSM